MEEESVAEAMENVYLCGELPMSPGGGVTRSVLGFLPLADSEKVDVGLQLCLLPGLVANLSQFKDLLTSSTFVLEVHKGSDVFARAFHPRNVAEYQQLVLDEKRKAEEENAVPDKKGGKKPPPKKGAPPPDDEDLEAGVYGPIKVGDQFLSSAIHRALKASRQLRPHGVIRFRLQNLLSSSNDMLVKFKRTRQGFDEDDERVVVAEEMNLEVRLEKPSKPEKWDLPGDISLRSALLRRKEEERSRLDGTLAGTVTKGGAGKPSGPPRHECFFTFSTHMEVDAYLYRRLQVSKETLFMSTAMLPLPSIAGAAQEEKEEEAVSAETDEVKEGEGEGEGQADLGVTLADWELQQKLSVTPYTRMIVLMKYMDDDTLYAIGEALNRINMAALPNIQGSIRSYSLTPEEVKAAKNGQLDLISGFMIIDDDLRLLVIEGLAGLGQGMQQIFADLPRLKPNDESLKIVCNPEVLFPERVYAEFSPDILRIRVRDKLKKLARKPEVYNRKQVEEICFDAIDGIMNLKRATDMETAKKLDMFPTAAALNELELLYGETISRTDMDGTARKQFVANAEAAAEGNVRLRNVTYNDNTAHQPTSPGKTRKRAQFQGTDCRNAEFEDYLSTRPVHRVDHITEHRNIRMQSYEDMLRRRSKLNSEYGSTLKAVLGGGLYEESKKEPKIHMYSNQSLNYKTKAFNKVRATIAQDKDATYTFSKDFVSQTICTVDLKLEAKREAAYEDSLMLTKGGFQYPKRKTPAEINTHDKRPTDARIEELSYAFKDKTDVVKPVTSPEKRRLEDGYKTMVKPEYYFGALKPAEYERDFELKLVGDRSKLPRGKLTGGAKDDKDHDFFRSIHVRGEEAQKIMEQAQAKEVSDWKAKVVVDSIDFKRNPLKVRDKPVACDKGRDILHGEPKQKALQQLRELKSHGGKDYGYKTTPLSLFMDEPFNDGVAGDNLLARQADKTKFITTRELHLDQSTATDSTAVGKDFRLYIKTGTRQDVLLSKNPSGYDPTGLRLAYPKEGPKWEPASSS